MANTETINRLISAFATASRLWDEAAARTGPGDLACRSGCFGCCVGLFEISLAEAVLVRAGVAALSPDDQADVRSRAQRISDESARAFPGDPADGVLDPGRSEESDDAYFDVVADRACPMLELPSGRCRIYEFRPITCRTYGFAWAKDGKVIHPQCGLNLTGATPARQLETAIDLDLLDNAEDVAEELAAELGLRPGTETTIPHAVVGTAFGPRPG